MAATVAAPCSCVVLRQIQDLELSLDVKLMKLSFLFGCSFVRFVGRGTSVGTWEMRYRFDVVGILRLNCNECRMQRVAGLGDLDIAILAYSFAKVCTIASSRVQVEPLKRSHPQADPVRQ